MRSSCAVSYDRLGGSSSVDLFELGWTLESKEGAGSVFPPLGDEPDSQQSGYLCGQQLEPTLLKESLR